ncbi:RNA polymerase sigma factor [Frankia sp. Cppng1_Ct_nod]|uniref:RNA polymerase sigma factor n=1 Tax=Frankia sp. Cppng1_Ct_nod TaxID=2897162 RepID=UPI001A944937
MSRQTGWPSEHLVNAAQQGDVASLSAVISGSHPHIRRFASSLCATPQDAEDAAQEALIILYRKIGTLRASGALASWMYRIVRNECMRRARLMFTRAAPCEDWEGPSAEEEALRRLEAERVAAAIVALPTDQRMVLIMRDIQGYPGNAVARYLGLSPAAMKSRLHRARATLRESLQLRD